MTSPAGIRTGSPRPSWLRARMAKWALLAYRLGLGRLLGHKVLVLTTTGRATTRVRRTPLWYVQEGDVVYCLSGWGTTSDWYRNVEADPCATLELGNQRWETTAEVIHERSERERVLRLTESKYGRLTIRVFYHLDLVALVAFPLPAPTAPAQE